MEHLAAPEGARSEGFPWDAATCAVEASAGNSALLLQWAKSGGCPSDGMNQRVPPQPREGTFESCSGRGLEAVSGVWALNAVAEGQLAVLKWARSQTSAFSKRVKEIAVASLSGSRSKDGTNILEAACGWRASDTRAMVAIISVSSGNPSLHWSHLHDVSCKKGV